MGQLRLCNVCANRVDVCPVQVLKGRLCAPSGRLIPAMVEAIEHTDGVADVPIKAPGSVTNPCRKALVTRHLWKEDHRCNIRMEVIGLVEALPIDEPEQLLLYERPAGAEPDLVTVKGRVALLFTVLIEFTGFCLSGSEILVTTKVENAAMVLVGSASRYNTDSA